MLRCCVTRPRSRQGLSTASPLGTDLGKNVDRPRPRGQGGKRCGAGHGQWRRWGDFGTCRGAVGSVRRKGDDDAARRGALACSSRKWCGGQGVRRRGPKGWCDARGGGERGRGGSEISCGFGPSSARSGSGWIILAATHPAHPYRGAGLIFDGVRRYPHAMRAWLGVVHDSFFNPWPISVHAPRTPLTLTRWNVHLQRRLASNATSDSSTEMDRDS